MGVDEKVGEYDLVLDSWLCWWGLCGDGIVFYYVFLLIVWGEFDNIVWKVEIFGCGYGLLIVVGDCVYFVICDELMGC